MDLTKSKKGMSLGDLPSAVILFGVTFIILAFVAIFLTNIGGTTAPGSVAENVTNFSLEGINQIGAQGTNIGLIIAIVVIITLLVGGLGFLIMRRMKG